MAEKEYIDRDAALKIIDKFSGYLDDDMIFRIKYALRKHIPAADVAPVRHGRWKKSKGNERPTENGFVHDDRYVCDCCGWGCCCETKLDFSFCPNCGAKMGGEVE